MNASEFAKRRARIDHEQGRSKDYARKAFDALIREARAIIIIRCRRVVGWRMQNGQQVCFKRRYRLLSEAQEELENVKREPRTPHIPHRVYECDHCHGWHLTSQRRSSEN